MDRVLGSTVTSLGGSLDCTPGTVAYVWRSLGAVSLSMPLNVDAAMDSASPPPSVKACVTAGNR